MKQKDCIFCNNKDDIIYETDNFYVKVGLGIIAPGHIMLIPKQHLGCYGDIPDNLIDECNELKDRITKAITKHFSEPFITELGIWCQSVNHAHIHFIPKQSQGYKINSIIKEMIQLGEADIEQVDFKRLKQIYEKEKRYMIIGENNVMYACHLHDIADDARPPNLAYRQFFTQIKGLKGVESWKNMSEQDKEVDNQKRELTKKLLINNI